MSARAVLPLVLLLAVGCDSGGAKSGAREAGRVAIVDLDEVFRRLGREAEVAKELSDKTASVTSELEKLRGTLNSRREAKAKELGEAPTAEQSEELRTLTATLSAQYSQEQQRAQREIELLRLSLAKQFREEVRPIAREVAAARGREVVLTKTDMVLVAPGDADITEAVIERMSVKSGAGGKAKE